MLSVQFGNIDVQRYISTYSILDHMDCTAPLSPIHVDALYATNVTTLTCLAVSVIL